MPRKGIAPKRANEARRLHPSMFEERVEKHENGCWLWVGPRAGRYGLWGRRQYAHREAYERARGPIPEGLYVCHSCDEPLCVNPDHLWVGTQTDNQQDAIRKGRR